LFKKMRLPLGIIRLDGGTQVRARLNQKVIDEYAEQMQQGHSFPPIVVFFDGHFYWLADGFHRVESALSIGFTEFNIDLKMGSLREAILFAVGANAVHGLRRTTEDKHHAVKLLLQDSEWGKWSDRAIAKHTQTSHPFVAKVRLELTGNISSERVYTTKHGTPATMNTSRIGKKSVADSVPRWLGIKPGLAIVRWAVLEDTGETMPILLDYGSIETTKKRPTFERLWELEQDLVALLQEFKPTAIAIEKPLFQSQFNNMNGILEAMGVIHLVSYRETQIIPIHLYAGMWKAHIGEGRAEVEEVTETIAILFDLEVTGKERLDAIATRHS
jgi:Holliday junction resolvasome RuvABC endonuclease subunit